MRGPEARRLVAFVLALAAAASSPRAAAAESDTGRADALFVEGRRLFDLGRYGEACETLAVSQRLAARVGTLGLLAACHEQVGKPATAMREYEEAAQLAQAGGDGREAYARARAAVLARAAGRVTVRLADPAAGEEIWIGGARAAIGPDGAVVVDPGRVEMVARAPGRREFAATVEVGRGQTATLDVPPLDVEAADVAPSPPAATAPHVALRAAPSADVRRPLGIAAVALGLGSLGASAGFGLAALVQKDASSPYCVDDRCTPRGGELRDRAAADATVATAAFALGTASLGAGLVVLLTAPHAPRDAARVRLTPSIGGASVSARF